MKRVQFKKVAICAFLALAFVSCSQDINSPNPKPDSRGPQLQLNYSFNDGYSAVVDQQPITRAVEATIPEKTVNDVAIIFYNERDGRYVACDTYNNSVNHGSSGSFTFATPAGVIAGQKYRLLIIGNYNSYKPAGQSIKDYMSANQGLSIEEMKKQLYVELSDDHRVVSPLPFVGQLIDGNGTPTVLTAPDRSTRSLNVSVRFSRIVSRFDLKNLAADQLNIQWAKVCQYRKGGYSHLINVPKGDIIRGTSRTAPNLGALPDGYVAASPKSGTTQNLLGGLYAFPNVVNISTQNDKETTFILIAGYYTAPGSPENTSKITYYRMNVSKNGKPQVLEQNNVYTLVINKVRGEGMETEEGAAQSSDLMLDYVADDFWENDATNNTNVDERGNYLTLSNTTVVLDSKKDEVAIVKVGVKDGLTWDAYWATNPTHSGQSKPVFTYEKIDATSFRITTNEENNSSMLYSGELVVKASNSSTNLQVRVNVVQLIKSPNKKLLMVDGKLEKFNYTVPGEGAKISLPVETGDPGATWKIDLDNSLKYFATPLNSIVSGSNNGKIILDFAANSTPNERTGVMTVHRIMSNGQEDPDIHPLTVTFVQPKSTMIVNYKLEEVQDQNITVDGFVREKGLPNTYAVKYTAYAKCVDWDKYDVKVESNFNKNVDLCLSKVLYANKTHPSLPVLYTSSAELTDAPLNFNNLDLTVNDSKFYIYVFRTGPADGPIDGDIKITATPKTKYQSTHQKGTYSRHITIISNCASGDVNIRSRGITYYYMDRNLDAPKRNTPGNQIPKFYSYDPNQVSYHNNNEWIGRQANSTNIGDDCKEYAKESGYSDWASWRLIALTSDYFSETLVNNMCYSKGRPYLFYYNSSQKEYIGHYYPMIAETTYYMLANDDYRIKMTSSKTEEGRYSSEVFLYRCGKY